MLPLRFLLNLLIYCTTATTEAPQNNHAVFNICIIYLMRQVDNIHPASQLSVK